ncbi:MAG: hypothetical protein WBA10_02365, partial [Elainellaceae cyanobacterium]
DAPDLDDSRGACEYRSLHSQRKAVALSSPRAKAHSAYPPKNAQFRDRPTDFPKAAAAQQLPHLY